MSKTNQTSIRLPGSEFTLCYRKSHSNGWECERGFDSVYSVDERTFELKNCYKNITTTFFPGGYWTTPTILRQEYIEYKLKPRVVVRK